MKKLIFMLCLCLLGCPNIKQMPTPNQESKVEDTQQNQPTEEELAEQQAAIKEEAAYEKSLDQIDQKMRDEYFQYKDCLDNNKHKKECLEMLERFCQVDALLDTRDGYHYKPYCRKTNK